MAYDPEISFGQFLHLPKWRHKLHALRYPASFAQHSACEIIHALACGGISFVFIAVQVLIGNACFIFI